MANTLIVSLQGIGNALLALPLAEAAHRAGERTTMLVLSPRLLPVLAHAPALDEALAADEPRFRGLRGRWRLLGEIRRRRFDRVFFAYPSGKNAYRFARLAGIDERLGHRYAPIEKAAKHLTAALAPLRKGHDLEQNMTLAEHLGWAHNLAELWPALTVPAALAERARQYLTKMGLDPQARYVGLHTGCDGRWVEKRWPEEHFAAVAEQVHAAYGLPAIVLDGPGEPGTGLLVKRLAKTPVHALAGWGDLADAFALLSVCDLFVSNDSGLMNLAAACGVPTVAVFGPSEPWRTRPYGPHGRAVISERTCAPCYTLGPYAGCPYKYHHCLRGLSPARVMATIDELMKR